jgi:hypothetical protein
MPEEKEPPSPKAIAAGLAFSGLAQIRNMEAQLRWVGFQFALGLNFVGWGGIAVWLFQEPGKLELLFILAVCLGAVYANRDHYKILGRDGKFMGIWNEKMVELEEANGIDGGVKIFSSPRYSELKGRTPTIQRTLRKNVVLSTIVWALFALWAFGWLIV